MVNDIVKKNLTAEQYKWSDRVFNSICNLEIFYQGSYKIYSN